MFHQNNFFSFEHFIRLLPQGNNNKVINYPLEESFFSQNHKMFLAFIYYFFICQCIVHKFCYTKICFYRITQSETWKHSNLNNTCLTEKAMWMESCGTPLKCNMQRVKHCFIVLNHLLSIGKITSFKEPSLQPTWCQK